MNDNLAIFRPGENYSNDEIFRLLGVGNAGGIRVKRGIKEKLTRIVIMTALSDAKNEIENPYHDRVEGDVLVYTAAGRTGDQEISGDNARILQQEKECFPIWAFQQQASRRDRKTGPKRWRFLGLLQYQRVYIEAQKDASGVIRQVYIFEFRIHRKWHDIPVALDGELMRQAIQDSNFMDEMDAGDRTVLDSKQEVHMDENPELLVQLDDIRRRLLSQDPRAFEITISRLLKKSGFCDIEVTKYS